MTVGIHANIVDSKTDKIGDKLRYVFDSLCDKLNGEYGGTIEHLWIDFELIEQEARLNSKHKLPFRFAKRVSGRSSFGLPRRPDYFNVGHISVRPNFQHLLSISTDEVVLYCLNLIYHDLIILKSKEKKLGGFDSELFRSKFQDECKNLGYFLRSN